MKEVDAAWVAGIIEGEGCFSPRPQYGRLYARVKVGMTDEDVVRKLQSTSGLGNVTGPYSSPRRSNPAGEPWKPVWHWAVTDAVGCATLIEAILPWLGERRSVAALQTLELARATFGDGRHDNTNHRKTHCPAGHAYDAENTYVHNGRRHCKRCRSTSAKRKKTTS